MNHDRLTFCDTSAQPLVLGDQDAAGAGAAALDDVPPAIAVSGPEEVRSPAVLIEIDPAVAGGFIRNRFDITICGRVVSNEPLAETRLQVADEVASSAWYGQAGRAPGTTAPDGSRSWQRAFRFNLPRQPLGVAERCAFQVVARTGSGLEYAEQFAVNLYPNAEPPVSLASGPARTASDASAGRPYIVLYVERGAIGGDGVLTVQGWAIAVAPILAIRIFAGAQPVGEATLGGDREDVAAAFRGYPNASLSGFSFAAPLNTTDQAAETIKVQVVCANGYGHDDTIPVERLPRRHPGRAKAAEAEWPKRSRPASDGSGWGLSAINQGLAYHLTTGAGGIGQPSSSGVAPADDGTSLAGVSLPLPLAGPHSGLPSRAARRAAEATSAKIEMYCDEARLGGDGTLSVKGWATCKAGIARVRVLLNDQDVGLAALGHDRPDVGRIFHSIPMAHLSGFKFERKVCEQISGEHKVRVIACNMHNDERHKEIAVVAVPLDAQAVSQPAALPSDPATEPAAEFRFELDSPRVTNGVASATVSGRLTIDGWLLCRSGVSKFEVLLDGQRLGDAHYGLARQDVGAAFPEWPNALRAGYAFHCPPRSLKDGDHTMALRVLANNGQELAHEFRITVKKSEEYQELNGIRRRVPRAEADMALAVLASLDHRPAYRFILRQEGPIAIGPLLATFEALRAQAYAGWTVLVIADDDAAAPAMRAIIAERLGSLADRFTFVSPCQRDAWHAPLAQAEDGRGVLHALLLPGDEPGADALLELAVAGGINPAADMLYADEVRRSPVSEEQEPFFKPDYSPDLMLSTNYIGRPWVATSALLARTGVSAASLLADGEYDLVLRCAELAAGIHHVPRLLCERAATDLDTAGQEQSALRRMLDRRGIAASVIATPVRGTWRVRRELVSPGKVSIIIPTCAANGYIETIISTLRSGTAYRDFEIIVIDNIPASGSKWKAWLPKHADKIVTVPGAFNWASFNNRAAEVADGEYLLFLNDDMEVTGEDWLDALLEHVQRPEVGIAGPQLVYRDGTVQHAGMFLANNGIGRHAFRFASAVDPCYFGLNLTQRNVIAVTGACMLVRREVFDRLGGFNEAHQITNNDLDFCLRAHRAGLLTVFTPYASLIHYELASRAGLMDVFDQTEFDAAWKTTFAAGDPYFNPRLSRHADDYRPDEEPVQGVVCGTPLFHKAEIERILVVKLDHIGDFVTALLPIRRLKTIFPHARITVLAGPASQAFIALEPSIDAFIPFAFFHARSQLGERELTPDDYADLSRQLRPYRFDLAVDLRKHPSTRDVLKYSGARFLAGFDHLGQYPYLDVALDWDGDRSLQRKRSHVADDLIALVDAIGHAAENDRAVMQPGPQAMPLTEMPGEVAALFARPVVAIHPGAGNITKQWPTEHFSALIDLLIERHDVNILLVGGPDEVEIADLLLRTGLYPRRMATMAGKARLADLPRLLKACVLYIGNDSGPKHVAAAIGIATIGIHSGVVDPVEWGPIGVNAMALRRNMACSPCYLAKAEDCPRALACLRFLEPNHVYEIADRMLTPLLPLGGQANLSDG